MAELVERQRLGLVLWVRILFVSWMFVLVLSFAHH